MNWLNRMKPFMLISAIVIYPTAWEVIIDEPSADLPNGSPETGSTLHI